MKQRPIAQCIILSESGSHRGVLMMFGIDSYQPNSEPLKLPARPFREHEGKTIDMYFNQVKHLTQENRKLVKENAEVEEAYRTVNREYKELKRKYYEKLAN